MKVKLNSKNMTDLSRVIGYCSDLLPVPDKQRTNLNFVHRADCPTS